MMSTSRICRIALVIVAGFLLLFATRSTSNSDATISMPVPSVQQTLPLNGNSQNATGSTDRGKTSTSTEQQADDALLPRSSPSGGNGELESGSGSGGGGGNAAPPSKKPDDMAKQQPARVGGVTVRWPKRQKSPSPIRKLTKSSYTDGAPPSPTLPPNTYKPFKPGFKAEGIRNCMAAANMTQWFFTGTSHIRNLIESLSALVADREFTRVQNDDVGRLTWPAKLPVSWITMNIVRDVYMVNNLTLPADIGTRYPDIPARYDTVVMGRYMWDVDINNTFPHDYYTGVVDRIEDILRRVAVLAKEKKEIKLKKIFIFMPYALKELGEHEPFLIHRQQCRTPSRIAMFRRMARCAAHFANTRSEFSKPVNGVQPPKIDLFDAFEFTKSLPNSATYNGANHYHPEILQAMWAQLFDRHVCPGQDIAGATGFNAEEALPFDRDPWAGVEEDCKPIFAAAEKKDAPLEYGPIGEGTLEGQMYEAPKAFDRNHMHLYRNYTPVDAKTGEIFQNGFRILPTPMRPIDKLYQNSFDRLARSCSYGRGNNSLFYDGYLLEWKVGEPHAAREFYCTAKRAWEQKEVVSGLPTYMNFTAMNEDHWKDLLSLVTNSKLGKQMIGREAKRWLLRVEWLRKRIKMCMFNLGARAEDVEDDDYMERLKEQLHPHWRFVCQCSGIFAPHLLREREEDPKAFNEEYRLFCKSTWPNGASKAQLKRLSC